MNKDVVYQFVFLNLNENNSSDNVTREQKLGAFDKHVSTHFECIRSESARKKLQDLLTLKPE